MKHRRGAMVRHRSPDWILPGSNPSERTVCQPFYKHNKEELQENRYFAFLDGT